MSLSVAYVVKRFPRASETFIAQEILELEKQGAAVTVLTLWPNDAVAAHRWLEEIEAPVVHCGDTHLSDAWKWLHQAASQRPERRDACDQALAEAFQYPDRRGRHRFREAMAVARTALEAGVQHLHGHFANDPAFVTYLAHLASGLPFSFTAHAKDIYAKSLPTKTLQRVVDHAAFAVTVSEDNRRHLAARLGPKLGGKVLRLHNGVDLESIEPSQPSPTEVARLGIVCVARLIPKKGVDVLIQALGLLARQGLDFHATIIGDGPQRAALEALIATERLDRRVVLTGTLPHEQVVATLHQHQVLALPARIADNGDQDALPTVLLEAMAAGLPCVSTPVGGIPEIIAHRKTGAIVPSDRPLLLAQALTELGGNERLRRQWGAAGRRRACELFDRSRAVARLHEWFARSSRGETVIDDTRRLRAVEA